MLDDNIKQSHSFMANTLLTYIGSAPSLNSIGPVGATILARIRGMETVKEIKDYIEEICREGNIK